jgi:putative endonuclease
VRTDRQASGDAAEDLVAATLVAAGWTLIGRNVHVGRAEIDIIATDPGPPPKLVMLEVRWRGRRDYGLAEETVDRAKQARLHGAAWRWLDEHRDVTSLPVRFDLVVVEPGSGVAASARVRHHRAAF